MATHACRSCGTTVPADATTCPECGVADPVAPAAGAAPARRPPPTDPAPGSEGPRVADRSPTATPDGGTTGSRVRSAAKAIGCLVIAVIVLLIAVAVGLLDFLF